jgi:hypothetical protein
VLLLLVWHTLVLPKRPHDPIMAGADVSLPDEIIVSVSGKLGCQALAAAASSDRLRHHDTQASMNISTPDVHYGRIEVTDYSSTFSMSDFDWPTVDDPFKKGLAE